MIREQSWGMIKVVGDQRVSLGVMRAVSDQEAFLGGDGSQE